MSRSSRLAVVAALTALSSLSITLADGPVIGPDGWNLDSGGVWTDLWERHRWHLLTIFALEETEHLYADAVGTSVSPTIFGEPPSFDIAIHERLSSDTPTRNFVTENKTNLFRGIALASVAATHWLDYGGMADEALGLAEALKFNTSINSLVKMVAGRQRPELGMSDPSELGQARYDQLLRSEGQHLSFYSAATSEAFTMASYVDLMISARLQTRPKARAGVALGLYGLAAYIGYSRMEQGEHYFTDVAAGAAAGVLAGRGFYRAHHREPEDSSASWLRFTPPVPIPGGLLVTVSLEPRRPVAP